MEYTRKTAKINVVKKKDKHSITDMGPEATGDRAERGRGARGPLFDMLYYIMLY